MFAAKRERVYTEGIWVKVTPETAAAIKQAAGADGIREPEWLRKMIASALRPDPNVRMLLAELMAMRMTMLSLYKNPGLEEGVLTKMVKDIEGRRYAWADKQIEEAKLW